MKKLILFILILLTLDSFSQTYNTTIYTTDSLYIDKFFKIQLPQNGYKNFYFQLYGPYSTIPSIDYRCYTMLRYNFSTGQFQNDFHNSALNRTYVYWSLGGLCFGYVIDFDIAKTDTNLFLYSYQEAWWEPMVYIYRSTNNGLNLSQCISFPMESYSCGIAINPVDKNIMYVGYPVNFINKTTNGGLNWFVTDTVTGVNSGSVMKINPFNTNTVFLSKTNGLLRSTNGGYDFQNVNINPVNITKFVFDNSDNSVYATAATNNAGILKSTNNGDNWSIIFNSICYDLEIDPLNSNVFYAGTQNGVYKTTNRGVNWFIYNNSFTPSKYVYGIVKNPNSGDTLFVVTKKNVYKVFGQCVVGIENPVNSKLPDKYSLSQNYPNPFNPKTIIRFNIPKLSSPHPGNAFKAGSSGDLIKINVFNILGKEVATLVNEKLKPGQYEVTFDGSNLPSGIYYYNLISGDYCVTRKMVLIK